MAWIKRLFGPRAPENPREEPAAHEELPPITSIAADQTGWKVPILDVRPVTQGLLSTTTDPKMAANSVSFSNEDGLTFAGQKPASRRVVAADLQYGVDGKICDGVLFNPEEMEHKWALYFHGGRIIVVRSWTRRVWLVAETRTVTDGIRIDRIQGSVYRDDEPASFTIQAFDFLIASHAMRLIWPAPIPREVSPDDRDAALWVMNCFGSLAEAATRSDLVALPPKRLLRTDSLLHIAAARGQLGEIQRLIEGGYPVDLRSRTGLTALHWAIQVGGVDAATRLLDLGADVNCVVPHVGSPLLHATGRGHKKMEAMLKARGGVSLDPPRA